MLLIHYNSCPYISFIKMNRQKGKLNEISFSCFLLYTKKVLPSCFYFDICMSQCRFRLEIDEKLHYRHSLLKLSLVKGTINFDASNSVGFRSLYGCVFFPLASLFYYCHKKTNRHTISKMYFSK